MSYTYDGDGRRVKKSTGPLYWYSAAGDVLAESSTGGTLTAEYVFFHGRRIARRDAASGAIRYYFSDHLGSASVITNEAGTIVEESQYFPFGAERAVLNGDTNPYKFTGKERDSETGLDYFGARYYGSTMGRFTSADPISLKQNRLFDPQRLNLYAYCHNNPLTCMDPDGRDGWDIVSGVGQGLRNFGVNTYSGLKTAAQHPSTLVTGTVQSLKTAGHAYFTSEGRSQMAGQFNSLSTKEKTAVVTEALTQGVVGAALTKGVGAATRALSGAGTAETATTTVTHFTSDAGVQGITESGGMLRSGTFVTTPGEIPAGATSGQVESLLEIGPGKGANSVTFETPNSNLTIPENGPTTSGGATQFQLKEPTQIDPTKFKKTE